MSRLVELNVRFASKADELICAMFDKRFPTPLLEHQIASQSLILADLDDEPVGYLRLEYLWGKVPYIGLIVVRESQRGRGIGKSILAFLEAHLRNRGCPMLLSSSQADEAAPQAWHRAVGFHECGIIAGINEGGIGEVFFRKDL